MKTLVSTVAALLIAGVTIAPAQPALAAAGNLPVAANTHHAGGNPVVRHDSGGWRHDGGGMGWHHAGDGDGWHHDGDHWRHHGWWGDRDGGAFGFLWAPTWTAPMYPLASAVVNTPYCQSLEGTYDGERIPRLEEWSLLSNAGCIRPSWQ